MHIHIYVINTELLDGNQGHQEETHRPTHRFRRLFLDLLWMGWRGCASAMGAIKLPPFAQALSRSKLSAICSDLAIKVITHSSSLKTKSKGYIIAGL